MISELNKLIKFEGSVKNQELFEDSLWEEKFYLWGNIESIQSKKSELSDYRIYKIKIRNLLRNPYKISVDMRLKFDNKVCKIHKILINDRDYIYITAYEYT
ncbi:putative phage head-tail joining protein [Candidatus Cyrtobacter comes]|uniref:Phage head-tail joining protein n=1 Tax=Candidatus Cyrtobacter comes TaxID=675776 RepID=A0ABU5L8R0_9RICK|nr:head-tail adaptor protein [Candidatus Cyrtobacter comes]MDZ5762507.1 putative phage head-tail joining protein [Candidatus Cyrtobacter comes]